MNMVDTIKTIVKNYNENDNLSDVIYGTITLINPLSVRIEPSQIIISSSFLVVPLHLIEHAREMTVGGVKQSITVHSMLEVGDKVILAKKHGGQLFTVLGKVG